MKRLFTSNHEPSRELVPIDDAIAALPFIVRRDHRIVATFARKATAEEWAQGSRRDRGLRCLGSQHCHSEEGSRRRGTAPGRGSLDSTPAR